MTGSEIREILDVITKAHPAEEQPASEKQTNWIAALAESAQLSESDACALVEVSSFSELTGGRNGSASKLIEQLRPVAQAAPNPACEKQLNLIQKLGAKAELSETEACALVDVKSFSELAGGRDGSASKLITILIKRTGGSGKKGKTKKS